MNLPNKKLQNSDTEHFLNHVPTILPHIKIYSFKVFYFTWEIYVFQSQDKELMIISKSITSNFVKNCNESAGQKYRTRYFDPSDYNLVTLNVCKVQCISLGDDRSPAASISANNFCAGCCAYRARISPDDRRRV